MNPGILPRGLSLGQDAQSHAKEVKGMRLIITKPDHGAVNIQVEDRRGLTGRRWSSKGVKLADVAQVVGSMLAVYEERRESIKSARKPKNT